MAAEDHLASVMNPRFTQNRSHLAQKTFETPSRGWTSIGRLLGGTFVGEREAAEILENLCLFRCTAALDAEFTLGESQRPGTVRRVLLGEE